MPACEQTGDRELDRLLLADDDLTDLSVNAATRSFTRNVPQDQSNGKATRVAGEL
jgi:hypothetical protein